jgi:hypothetical protein
VALRRRGGWEAAEMGVLLWRSNGKALLLFFGLPLTLCALGVRFLPPAVSGVGGLVLWWLLPFLDRFALQVVSVRFFEPRSPVKQLFKGLGANLFRGLPGDLLWRRFSPFRSAQMPIAVLEKLRGKRLRERKRLLRKNGLDFGFTLTLICLGLELALGLGELVFIYTLGELSFPWFFGGIGEIAGVLMTVTWINQVLIESLYVCMGFGLYINSRVETEGWDLELLFKGLGEKKPPPGRGRPAAFTAAFWVLAVMAAFPGLPANAAEPAVSAGEKPAPPGGPAGKGTEAVFSPPPADKADAALLGEVLASPDFGTTKPGWKIRFKKKPPGDKTFSGFPALRDFPDPREILGLILRAALISAAAAALAAGAYAAYRRRRLAVKTGKRRGGGPEASPEPADSADPAALLDKAAVLHRAGRVRNAWALCLRAFIAAFSAGTRRLIPGDATEYEVLALARRESAAGQAEGRPGGDPARLAALENFIRRWVSFAYGGREPEKESFETSLRDCRGMIETPREGRG